MSRSDNCRTRKRYRSGVSRECVGQVIVDKGTALYRISLIQDRIAIYWPRSKCGEEKVMPILVWCSPFIIFSGACDLVYSIHKSRSLTGSYNKGIPNDIVEELDDR